MIGNPQHFQISLLPDGAKKEIQIVTTYDPAMALTEEHLKEFGYAFSHEIKTSKQLAEWRRNKRPVQPVANNTRTNVEQELSQIVERIKIKVKKNYSPGMILLVYSYLDHTEEHFSAEEITSKVLAGPSDVLLKDFSEVFLTQPRRVIRIK